MMTCRFLAGNEIGFDDLAQGVEEPAPERARESGAHPGAYGPLWGRLHSWVAAPTRNNTRDVHRPIE